MITMIVITVLINPPKVTLPLETLGVVSAEDLSRASKAAAWLCWRA